jgi:hypothetical protein
VVYGEASRQLFAAVALAICVAGCSTQATNPSVQTSAGLRRSAIEGAVLGGLGGAYTSAWLTLAQGVGGGSSSATPWIAAGTMAGALIGGTTGYLMARRRGSPPQAFATTVAGPAAHARDDPLNPRAGQIDLQVENLSGFVGPGGGSLVRVREFSTGGTALHFPAVGINAVQVPTLDIIYWFDALNAVDFQFRYLDVTGSHFLSYPANFNGSTMAPGQTLHAENFPWFSGGLYYERRLTPAPRGYETRWPSPLRDWDLCARLGIEYTYLNWEFNGGHARVTPASKGEETKEDFYHQELPIPTVGLEALRRINDNLTIDGAVTGNWINRWNSLRDEGGTVWLSQSGAEGHLRFYYSNRAWLGPVRLMAGAFIYYYRQLEDSHEDGNFVRWSSWGPEYGLAWTFRLK